VSGNCCLKIERALLRFAAMLRLLRCFDTYKPRMVFATSKCHAFTINKQAIVLHAARVAVVVAGPDRAGPTKNAWFSRTKTGACGAYFGSPELASLAVFVRTEPCRALVCGAAVTCACLQQSVMFRTTVVVPLE
jgi:hypothetical protein